MDDGKIIRYLEVNIDGRRSWYKDDSDSVEIGDIVLVSYGIYEIEAVVVNVVRCAYPYVVYPYKKTKSIYEIIERAAKK